MTVKKFGLSSLFVLLISATSTGFTSQTGSAATSQALSYSPVQQTICGCPQPPGLEGEIKSTYRSHIYCRDVSSLPGSVSRKIYCPDFRKSSKIPTAALQRSVRLAYDPDAREAEKNAREADRARGHSLEGVRKGVEESVLREMRQGREPGLGTVIRGVFEPCASCHLGGGRNRNPN